eukprot:1157577-Pelagomonas_calceolata.AAC.2
MRTHTYARAHTHSSLVQVKGVGQAIKEWWHETLDYLDNWRKLPDPEVRQCTNWFAPICREKSPVSKPMTLALTSDFTDMPRQYPQAHF